MSESDQKSKRGTRQAPGTTRRAGATATLAEVALLAGVSSAVAGQVLNGSRRSNTRFSKETAERVRQIAHRLHYRPNHAAQQLRGKRSHAYGLLVAAAGDPLRSFLVQFLDTEAAQMGCNTIIGNTVVAPNRFEHFLEMFCRRGVDGILCAVHHWFNVDLAALLAQHPNTVFYENPHIAGSSYVTVDREEAGRLAVRHLAAGGRRRIGLALMTCSRSTHLARRAGYESELAAQGLPVAPELVFNGEPYGLSVAQYNRATHQWSFPLHVMDLAIDALIVQQQADAIVAHDDFWAAALIRRMRARGIRVPDDVAVVGYLNHYLADWTDPPLTTIDLEHRVAAKAMVEMLERTITQGPLPEEERVATVRPSLVVRGSA